MKYGILSLTFLICLMSGCNSDEDAFTAAYLKSVAWLWNQQSEDGAWHSKTHNVLQDGTVLTPYILYYLLQVPDSIFGKDSVAVMRGIEFVRQSVSPAFANSTQEANYPNYSAAYALRVLCLTNTDTALQQKLVDHLLQEQFTESRGILPSNVAYGSWGYGEPDLPFGAHGHVDLSHTRRIIEALLEIHPPDPPQGGSQDFTSLSKAANISPPLKRRAELVDFGGRIMTPSLKGGGGMLFDDRSQSLSSPRSFSRRVSTFLHSVQRSPADTRTYDGCTDRTKIPYDGGFVSSMATLSTNKCQPIPIEGAGLHYPSYATATCDGLLALYALGMQETEAYRDAVQWLTDHQRIDIIDGLSPDDPEQWYQVMHYYHWAVRAEAMTAARIEGSWRKELMKALVKEQQSEGYYINPIGGVNKEDDPLMATVFCVQAFTALYSNQY